MNLHSGEFKAKSISKAKQDNTHLLIEIKSNVSNYDIMQIENSNLHYSDESTKNSNQKGFKPYNSKATKKIIHNQQENAKY